jgi:hypothetical protein
VKYKAVIHSTFPPLNKGAIDLPKQQKKLHEENATKKGKNIYLFMRLYCSHAKAKS